MEAADKIAVVHKYVEAFDKQDMDIIREIYAADGVVEDPVGTDRHEGLEATYIVSALPQFVHPR